MAGLSKPRTISTKQARIAKLAKQMPDRAIHSLSHHMDVEWLREAFRRTRKNGATGVDGQTAEDYEANLDDNLQLLLDRVKAGKYRAPPVRRVLIPKGNGKSRPIGIPTFEDKVLQRAVVMLLQPLYEQDFYDFSYGFRPRRSAHDALDVIGDALVHTGGGWVLDVDIASFFDTLNHEKLRDLLRKRVTDGVVVRLIGKWLRAGVLEGGVVRHLDAGTPQGGVISPLLANLYLHEVLDTWWVEEILPRVRGRAFLVRYADDFVMGFTSKKEAVRVHQALAERFSAFGLTLHPEKTRLVYHRRPRRDGGGPKSDSFDFLGFTLYWGKSRRGKRIPKRKTSSKSFSRAKKAINAWLRKARHLPIRKQGTLLAAKVRGHFNYYGISGNSKGISRFRYEVERLWRKWLSRRSQRGYLTWEKFKNRTAAVPLPRARIRPRRVQYRLANL